MRARLSLLVTFASIMLHATVTLAQESPIGKGSKMVDGAFLFSSMGGDLYEGPEGDRWTVMQFTPSYSQFIASGFAVGVTLLTERTSRGDWTSMSWGIGPKLQYFFGGTSATAIHGSTYPVIGTSFVYHYVDPGSGSDYSGTSLNFDAGLVYMLSNSVGISAKFQYAFETLTREDHESVSGNHFDIMGGFAIFL